jgi:hypothetical protein
MLVRMKVGIAGPLYVLDPGDEFHFPDDEAGRLIAAGHAEAVEPAKTTEPAKTEKPDVAPTRGKPANRRAGDVAGSEAAGQG